MRFPRLKAGASTIVEAFLIAIQERTKPGIHRQRTKISRYDVRNPMPRRDEPELDIRAITLLLIVLALPAAIPASVRSSHSAHSLFRAAGLRGNPIVFLPIAMAGVMAALWHAQGRSPEVGSVAPRYAPPGELSPMEAGVLVDGRLDPRDVVAGVVDLAIRGYLSIEPIRDDARSAHANAIAADYRFQNLHKQGWATQLPDHDRFLMQHIFEVGSEPLLSALRHNLNDYLSQFRDAVFKSLLQKKLYRLQPDLGRTVVWVGAGLLLMVVAFVAQVLDLKLAESAVLYALSFAAAAGTAYWMGRGISWRSPGGQVALREVLGLQEFLQRVEKDRLRQLPSETLERLLPYAMALGVEGQWVGAFKGLVAPYPWYTQAAAAVVAASQSDDSTRAEVLLLGLDAMTRIVLQGK
jgi:hypothetical protein